MNKPTAAPAESAPDDSDNTQTYTLPCAEALLAGTLAVMTGHMQACCDGHRDLMARKAVANLGQLSQHPLLSPQFKTMLWNLRALWEVQLQAQLERGQQPAADRERDGRLWHATPESVQ